MKPCSYRTEKGAQRFADKLASVFPKRQFKPVSHPYDFTWSVGVYNDGQFLAYAGKRKSVRRTGQPDGQPLA